MEAAPASAITVPGASTSASAPAPAMASPCSVIVPVIASPNACPRGDALGPLIGAARAAILRTLTAPATTSQLAAQLGLSPGTVGGHLAVLRAAGLRAGPAPAGR
jgi:DNA-binding transcriptional ArsR family regulator